MSGAVIGGAMTNLFETKKLRCKYCDKVLPESDLDYSGGDCANCRAKRIEVKRFIKACKEFKAEVEYDKILRIRESRARRARNDR